MRVLQSLGGMKIKCLNAIMTKNHTDESAAVLLHAVIKASFLETFNKNFKTEFLTDRKKTATLEEASSKAKVHGADVDFINYLYFRSSTYKIILNATPIWAHKMFDL